MRPTGQTSESSGDPGAFRWRISEDANAYKGGASGGDTVSYHDGKLTSNGSVSVQMMPNKTFYLWIYPSNTSYNRYAIGSVSVTFGGAYGEASTVTCTNPATFGTANTITLSRNLDSALHTVKVTCLGQTETLLEQSATYPTVTWTPSVATYAPLLTNAKSTTATITVETFYSGYSVGTRSVVVTINFVDADVAPYVTMAVNDPTGHATTYGAFVASKSKIKVELSATYRYGAVYAATAINANGQDYATNPATTDEIVSTGNTAVSGRIVDSRGVSSNTAQQTITILPYSPPQITSFTIHRCNQDGTLNDQGAYCRVDYSVEVSPLNNHNSKTLVARYKKRSAETYTDQAVTLSTYAQTGYAVVPADTNDTYDIQLALTDDFGSVAIDLQLSTAFATMNFKSGGDGIAIGKVAEFSKMLELAAGWKLAIDGVDQFARVDTAIGAVADDVADLTLTVQGLGCEIGANSNGSYAKFANGLLLCWKSVTHTNVAITTAWGAMYESPSLSFGDWPVAFAGIRPFVSVDVTTDDNASSNAAAIPERIQGVSLTSAGSAQFIRPASTTGTICVDIIGIGLWAIA